MKAFHLVLCVALASAQGDTCAPFCECDGGVVLCRNTPVFPQFLTTGAITTIIIIDGTLSNLPVTEANFPQLTSLILRNCRFISCQQIYQIQQAWSQLNIESNVCATDRPLTDHVTDMASSGFTTTQTRLRAISGSSARSTTAFAQTSTMSASSDESSGTSAAFSQFGTTVILNTVTATSVTMSQFETSNVVLSSEKTDRDNGNLQTILASSITVMVLIIVCIIGVIVYCIHKKINRDRVVAFDDDDFDDGYDHVPMSIVNPAYNSYQIDTQI